MQKPCFAGGSICAQVGSTRDRFVSIPATETHRDIPEDSGGRFPHPMPIPIAPLAAAVSAGKAFIMPQGQSDSQKYLFSHLRPG